MRNLRIDIVDNMHDWQKIREPWNELLEKSASDCFFLTWEWLYSWAECFLCNRNELFIVVIYEGNEVIAIAPWHIRHCKVHSLKIRQIEFLGTPEAGSDYLDVIIRGGREKEVTGLLYEFLLGDASHLWERLRLYDIPSNSIFLLHFINKIREIGKYAAIEEASFCPITILPKTEGEFLASLSSKRRRRIENLKKRFDIDHVVFASKDIDVAIKDFFNLYEKKTSWNGDRLYPLIRTFMDKGLSPASIQVDFLSTKNVYIAGMLHFRYRNTLSQYLQATDKTYNPKLSIGNFLVGLCIINAIRCGFSFYDFLKGVEEYKFQWANFGKRSTSVIFSTKRTSAVILTLSDICKSAAKLVLR